MLYMDRFTVAFVNMREGVAELHYLASYVQGNGAQL